MDGHQHRLPAPSHQQALQPAGAEPPAPSPHIPATAAAKIRDAISLLLVMVAAASSPGTRPPGTPQIDSAVWPRPPPKSGFLTSSSSSCHAAVTGLVPLSPWRPRKRCSRSQRLALTVAPGPAPPWTWRRRRYPGPSMVDPWVNAQEEGSTTGGGGECGGPVAEEGSRGVGVECGSPVTEEGSVLLTRRGLVGGEGAWAAWHLDKEDKVEGR
jgi:hypothetical protein